MKHDDEIVQTSHGPSTVHDVREHDIPHWRQSAAHANEVVRKLRSVIGMEVMSHSCPHCNKPI